MCRGTASSSLVGIILALVLAGPGLVASESRGLSAALAEHLRQAEEQIQAGAVTEALAHLAAWRGPDHPLIAVLRGHAHHQADDHARAAEAYRAALAVDPDLAVARQGLVLSLLAGEDLAAARAAAGRYLAASTRRDDLLLYARVAHAADDLPLLRVIAERGLRHHPDDASLRRLLLVASGDDPVLAGLQVRWLLSQEVDDPGLWRHLAALAQGPAAARQALIVAALADPQDPDLAARHLAALLAAGHHPAARRQADHLAGLRDSWPEPHSLDWTALLVEAALASDDLSQAQIWLEAIPRPDRPRRLHLLAARLALRREDHSAARQALGDLLAAGDEDPMVLLWAAHLEERHGAADHAEALYRQAMEGSGQTAITARLHLARLLLHHRRHDEAAALLRSHLNRHPDDEIARRLLMAVLARQGKGGR